MNCYAHDVNAHSHHKVRPLEPRLAVKNPCCNSNTGGFGDFYTMKRSSGFNNEFLLAKFLKFMEDEQMRAHDY